MKKQPKPKAETVTPEPPPPEAPPIERPPLLIPLADDLPWKGDAPLDRLVDSPTNPRKTYDPASLAELGHSILEHGLLQSLVVRPRRGGIPIPRGVLPTAAVVEGLRATLEGANPPSDMLFEEMRPLCGVDDFEIVVGHRRKRGAALVGLQRIDVIVRVLSDKEVLEIQLIENTQREDVHPLEEADGMHALITQHEYTAEALASRIGKSVSHVYKRLKLCTLCPIGRELFLASQTSHMQLGHAELIVRIDNAGLQEQAIDEAGLRPRTDGGYRNVMTVAQLRDHIMRRYVLRLLGAPFNPNDVALVEGVGVCGACPKRTGAQPLLFTDVGSDDLCTDPACFSAKTEAAWKHRVTEAETAGQRVLSDEQARTVFGHGSTSVSYNAPFIDLDDVCHEVGKGKPWRKLLGKQLPPITLALDSTGAVHELVTRADVKKLAEAQRAEGKTGGAAALPAPSPTQRDANKAANEKAKIHRAATSNAIAKLVSVASKRPPNDAQLRLLVTGVLDGAWSDTTNDVARRRGFEKRKDGKGASPTEQLAASVATLKGNELYALLLEIVVTRGVYFAHSLSSAKHLQAACGLYRLDHKQFESQAKAAASEAAKARKVPKAKRARVTAE